VAKQTKPTGRRARLELAQKKAKKRKIIVLSIVAVSVLAISVLVFILVVQGLGTETYTDGGQQSVRLTSDGSFVADLAHGVKYDGTFEKTEQEGYADITFTFNDGLTAVGVIVDDQLHLPYEWDDGHGHETVFSKR